MEQTDSCKRGRGDVDWLKEGEGTRQRTHMHHLWTWTMVWGLTAGVGDGLGGGAQSGGNWDKCNSINNKTFKRKMLLHNKKLCKCGIIK